MSEELETVPIGLRTTKNIEDLPHDILVEVFSYLSITDLVNSVQYVSSRWHSVVQDAHLWINLKYNPTAEDTDDEIVKILRKTPKLQTLNLEKRDVHSQVLCTFLENCSELRELTFNISQRLSKQTVKTLIENCKQLEYLTIPDRILSTLEGAEMIGQLQKLRTLNIAGWGDSPRTVLLKPIGDGCPLLQHLDIQHQSFNTEDLKYFMEKKQHQLESIKVRWNVQDWKCTIPHLTVCKTLKKLLIEYLLNVETTAGFEALKSMNNVTSLTFSELQYANVNNLVNLFSNKGMCHLVELKLNFYVVYEDRLSETVCNNCPLLKVLGFKDCFNMTDKSFENLPKLKELEYLNVKRCREMTDSGMDFVLKCKRLKYLSLSYCNKLTKRSMNQLTDLNKLQTLKLDFCNIEGLSLSLIPTRLPKLSFLSINYCKGVDWGGLNQLHAEMPRLTVHADH